MSSNSNVPIDDQMIDIDTSIHTASAAASNSTDGSSSTSPLPSSSLAALDTTDHHSPTIHPREEYAEPAVQSAGGVLVAFGSGMFGMLAAENEIDQPQPTVVEYFRHRPILAVAVGSAHALAVGADASLYSWGSNDEGQRGLGDKSPHKAPAEISALQTKLIVGASAGYAHSLALTQAGEVFAFGSGEMAQLGLTLKNRPKGQAPDLSSHVSPSLVRELSLHTKIIAVATGENHSLALSSAGRVYSVGDGSRGALGLDINRSGPNNNESGVRVAVLTEVASLLPIPIASIAAGAHHSLFVSAAGSVYSCGDSSKGRVGFSGTGPMWLPKRITGELDTRHVLTAAAGAQYSLFLTQSHDVYACGSNLHGELGLDPALTIVEGPKMIPGLSSIIQISAGATHALARDADNQVWSWGSNELSELGWPESSASALQGKRSLRPGLVALPKLFPHQHIVSISAGSNTSFVIIAQTILASNSSDHRAPVTPTAKMTPNAASASSPYTYQLFEPSRTGAFDFADVEMTDAETDSSSTSASSSTLSSSLVEPLRAASPQFIVAPNVSPVPLSSFSYTHFSRLLKKKEYVTLANYISHCFSSALILNASFLPSAAVGGGSYIDTTLVEEVYQQILKASLEFPKLQSVLASSVQKMVASMVLLLKQSRQPPKDLAAYRCVFIALQSPHLLHATASETQLLADIAFVLTRLPREVQLRVSDYIWPHVPLKLLHKRFLRVLLQNTEQRFKAALQGAGPQARLRGSSEEVQAVVSIIDSIYKSVQRQQERRTLKITSAPNDQYVIPASAWHIDVHRYIDLQSDLSNYLAATPTAAQLPPFSFMRYPYLLSPTSKVSYLRLEFALAMQQQIIGAAISGLNPHLELKVSRNSIVEDAVNALNRHTIWELRRPLKIIFTGEAGEDAGGLSAEFFETVFTQLSHPKYQLWEVQREWKTMWFSSLPMDPSKASLYQIVGMLLGLAVYNGSSIQLNLPIWFYAQLLGRKPTLADLKSLDSQLAHSLEELLRFEGDVENTFCLTFEISVPDRTEEEITREQELLAAPQTPHALMPGTPSSPLLPPPALRSTSEPMPMQIDADSGVGASSSSALVPSSPSVTSTALVPSRPRRFRNVPLLPGGEDIPVTQSNKAEYVALYLEYLFTKSVHQALTPLIAGFQDIVGHIRTNAKGVVQSDTASLAMFSPEDLELLVVGRKEMSFAELKRGAQYEGGYSATHPTIEAFWSIVLEDLTPKEQRQLLIFTTGSSRAPVGGLAEVRMLIQRAGPDSENLPTSSTCFAALLLPQYSSKEKMRNKLKLALANATGFGLR